MDYDSDQERFFRTVNQGFGELATIAVAVVLLMFAALTAVIVVSVLLHPSLGGIVFAALPVWLLVASVRQLIRG